MTLEDRSTIPICSIGSDWAISRLAIHSQLNLQPGEFPMPTIHLPGRSLLTAVVATAAFVCPSTPSLAAGAPTKLNSTLRSDRDVEEFVISADNRWVVYSADQDENDVFE